MDQLSPKYRARCLDGCEPTIALQHLSPHTVVSQVVWGDAVAAWVDPHAIRLSNKEVENATTFLDLTDAEDDTDSGLLCALISSLPKLRTFRGPGLVLKRATKAASNIETLDCTDTQVEDLVTVVPTKMPKLRKLFGSKLYSASELKETVQRLHGFSGFAWPRADEFRDWLFPAPDQLSQIRLGYLMPHEVMELLSLLPPTMTDVAVQGWARDCSTGRETFFNSKSCLPPFLEGFELQDDESEKPNHTFVPLQVWRFIEPAAHRLKFLVLSAPVSPEDLTNVRQECSAIEELSVALRFDDDPTAARGLLYSNAGLPRLRRLSVFVVPASDTICCDVWPALPRGQEAGESSCPNMEGDLESRATVTALCIGVDHYINGSMLRPFAPRLTELAVRRIGDMEGSNGDGHAPVSPVFPLLTSVTVRAHSAQKFQRILPFTPRLRRVICQESVDDGQEPTPYTVRKVRKLQAIFRRRGHFDFM